jgi:hypothetical protein
MKVKQAFPDRICGSFRRDKLSDNHGEKRNPPTEIKPSYRRKLTENGYNTSLYIEGETIISKGTEKETETRRKLV